MVDILIGWQRFEFEFKGEVVAMELRPMDVKAMLKLGGIDAGSPDEKQIDIMESIYEGHVRNIENLTIGGEAATPEALANIIELSGLSNQVMTKLTEITNLPQADKKKLNKPSTLPTQGADSPS